MSGSNQPPFSLQQSVFMLSLASNALFDQTGFDPKLLAEIQAYLGVAGGAAGSFFQIMNQPSPNYQCLAYPANSSGPADWQTAWGPAVFQAWDNPGATNAVFLAHSPSLNTYVVAIAGTNPVGANAMLFQDLDVFPKDMVAWPPTMDATKHELTWKDAPFPASSTPALAKGTADGLSRLYALTDPNSKATLSSFLSGAASASSTLVFAGHSLGGALSPMLALLLYPDTTPSQSGWGNIYILATAGPTPGTQGLANLFAKSTAYPQTAAPSYTPAGKQGGFALFSDWNVNYANAYDVVPRAWNMLAGLVTMPRDPLKPWPSFFAGGATLEPVLGGEVMATVTTMQTRAGYVDGSTAFYAPALTHSPFTGQWGDWNWANASPYPPTWNAETPLSDLSNFGQLSGYILNAHLSQYPYAFLGAAAPKMSGS